MTDFTSMPDFILRGVTGYLERELRAARAELTRRAKTSSKEIEVTENDLRHTWTTGEYGVYDDGVSEVMFRYNVKVKDHHVVKFMGSRSDSVINDSDFIRNSTFVYKSV